MSWNYRIVRYVNGDYGLHEVYYDDNGKPHARTEHAITACDAEEGPAGIVGGLELMLADARRNLDPRDILDDPWPHGQSALNEAGPTPDETKPA